MKTCAKCPAALCRQNKTGLCKTHWNEHLRSPEWRARVSATQRRILMERPALMEKRRELGRRVASLPATMAARKKAARENEIWKIGLAACTPESRKLAGRRMSETKLAWCPPELRDEYRALVVRHKIRAAEARQIILRQHETDMERFRNRIAPPEEPKPVEFKPPKLRPSAPVGLMDAVACDYGYPLADVLSESRARDLSRCRQTLYAVLRARGHSWALIAEWAGRDPKTVAHGVRHFDTYARHTPKMREVFNLHTSGQDNEAEAACAA